MFFYFLLTESLLFCLGEENTRLVRAKRILLVSAFSMAARWMDGWMDGPTISGFAGQAVGVLAAYLLLLPLFLRAAFL